MKESHKKELLLAAATCGITYAATTKGIPWDKLEEYLRTRKGFKFKSETQNQSANKNRGSDDDDSLTGGGSGGGDTQFASVSASSDSGTAEMILHIPPGILILAFGALVALIFTRGMRYTTP